MRKLLLFTSLAFLLAACNMTQDVKKTTTTTTSTSTTPRTTSTNTSLTGKWTLKSLSAFMHMDENQSYPKYEDGDVVWEFSGEDHYGDLIITKKNAKEENENSPAPGKTNYWARDCIIKVGGSMYKYSVDGDQLIIDSNVDPSYGADLAVMRFKRM